MYGMVGDTNGGGANNHKLRELQQEVKLIGIEITKNRKPNIMAN